MTHGESGERDDDPRARWARSMWSDGDVTADEIDGESSANTESATQPECADPEDDATDSGPSGG